ncbi:MAG TPA: replicative DNA helicase [Usitatibacteraceae bacterium]|nr:replicative DNA helicase [Usitatibacteraceae bacterium]
MANTTPTASVTPLYGSDSGNASIASLKLPQHSIEAEQSVLGGLLLNNEAWERIGDMVAEADFYRDDHRKVYRAIARLVEANKPADVLTVAEGLQLSGELQGVGGIAYLQSLVDGTPSAANIRLYAEIVRERAIMRHLARVGEQIADTAYAPNGREARQLLDEAEKLVFDIAEMGRKGSQGFQSMSSLLAEVMNRLDELSKNPSSVTGISTGFKDLDEMTSGMHPGDLIIVAGRPSMGKTAFSLNIAEHVALAQHLPVFVFSMEMGGTQIASRLLSSVARVDQQRVRTGNLENRDWDQLNQAMVKLNEAPMQIDETPGLNALELRARARRMHRQYGGAGLIVVDYLQLMSATSQGENRATEISEISRSLKALAKELKVPVIALSQLNRSVEQRDVKKPVMSDLRESGAIEQDADVILFLYRDEVYAKTEEEKDQLRGKAEVIIAKQRNGPIGTVPLTFRGQFTRFENAAIGSY